MTPAAIALAMLCAVLAVFVVNALSVAAGLMTYATMSAEEREEAKK